MVSDAGAVPRRVDVLFAEAESLNQLAIAVDIGVLEVVEQLAPLADKLEEAATRVMVFGVNLEMHSEIVDARRQERDLNLRRTGVALRALVVPNDLRFLRAAESHLYILQFK